MSTWTTLRDDLIPFRWHKDDNKEAWLRRLGEAALVFSGAGMFSAPAAATTTATAATEIPAAAMAYANNVPVTTAAEAAKQAAVQQALTQSPGMFNMIPGVSQGSAQHLALLEQNAGLGGAASDLTAQAAKTATGNAGFLDSLINTGKADLAGMNDPSVWLDRLGRNADRLAGNMGKSAATGMVASALMGGGQTRTPTAPPPPQTPQPQAPVDIYASSTKGGFGDANLDALAAKLGIPRAELKKMLDQMKARGGIA